MTPTARPSPEAVQAAQDVADKMWPTSVSREEIVEAILRTFVEYEQAADTAALRGAVEERDQLRARLNGIADECREQAGYAREEMDGLLDNAAGGKERLLREREVRAYKRIEQAARAALAGAASDA